MTENIIPIESRIVRQPQTIFEPVACPVKNEGWEAECDLVNCDRDCELMRRLRAR